ncbi:MAG: choice-of-anchor D domain-containing protein, partial [Bacteroidota bacterium]|nr:choice-of-anchor D domain-containing protein [Bacteroidota bacterium]
MEHTVVLHNPKPRQVTVKRLYLKARLAEFEIVEPTVFPIVLQPAGQPGDRIQVRLRATARIAEQRVDSLYAELSCYPVPVAELKIRGNEPIMWVDDADFGRVPVGTERMRQVRIEGRGQIPLEITAVDWPDRTHFRTEGLVEILPLRLDPGQTHTFKVYYKPTVAGAQDQTRALFTVNATKIKLYSDWRGTGIEANVAIQGYDWGKRRVADAYAQLDDPNYGYRGEVVITVRGNTPLNNVDVTVEDDPQHPGDRLVFRVNKSTLPPQLQPGDVVRLPAYFKPTEERGYRARVVVRGFDNNEVREAEDMLVGIGVQPHVAADGRDFGTLMVGQSKSDVAPVYSQGTMELTVRDFEIVGRDADAFRVEPNFLQRVRERGLQIQPGQSIDVPLIFTALRVGEHRANLRVISDAPETPEPELIGRGISQGLAATDYDFGRHFVTTRVDQRA